MWWLLLLAAGLLLATVLVLSVPLELRFLVHKEKRLECRLVIGWLFGLVRKEVFPTESPRWVRGTPDIRAPGAARSGGRKAGRTLLAVLRGRGLLKGLLRLARRVGSLVSFRDLRLDLRVGSIDPAETGFLFAVIGPVSALLGASWVNVVPDFSRDDLSLRFEGSVRLRPVSLAWALMAFALSPPALRAGKAMFASRLA